MSNVTFAPTFAPTPCGPKLDGATKTVLIIAASFSSFAVIGICLICMLIARHVIKAGKRVQEADPIYDDVEENARKMDVLETRDDAKSHLSIATEKTEKKKISWKVVNNEETGSQAFEL